MANFTYTNSEATPERLKSLRKNFEDATGEAKYYKWKAWLHFANLDLWRSQGHHFRYLSDYSKGEPKDICTCGLTVSVQGDHRLLRVPTNVSRKVEYLALEPMQLLEGHRDFSKKIPVCALIVDLEWTGNGSKYLWTAYCQVCGDVAYKVGPSIARKFVRTHNQEHLGVHRV